MHKLRLWMIPLPAISVILGSYYASLRTDQRYLKDVNKDGISDLVIKSKGSEFFEPKFEVYLGHMDSSGTVVFSPNDSFSDMKDSLETRLYKTINR